MKSYDPEEFKEKFPNLSEEIENRTESTTIDGVRTDSKRAEKAGKSERESDPNAVDFVRLCDDKEEAMEVINYMKEEGEIEEDYAEELKSQMDKQGIRSFGSKRNPGEYPSTK